MYNDEIETLYYIFRHCIALQAFASYHHDEIEKRCDKL